jgi:hypothetical protein
MHAILALISVKGIDPGTVLIAVAFVTFLGQ